MALKRKFITPALCLKPPCLNHPISAFADSTARVFVPSFRSSEIFPRVRLSYPTGEISLAETDDSKRLESC